MNNKILDKIWEIQKKFNSKFVDYETISDDDNITIKEDFTQKYALWLMGEVQELLREINFKSHRKVHRVIESNLKEEWIDIFKYWLSIGLGWGWKPEDFMKEFERKSNVVELRYEQEVANDLLLEKNLVAFDIDGVLADYPLWFQKFIQKKTGIWLDVKSYDLYGEYGAVLGQERIRELKHEYRETGEKRNIPLCDGAKKTLDHVHAKGLRVVFLTSRPYKQYARIFADTMEWLEKNGLKKDGDAIIFDEDKNYRAIRDFPNMKFMVEDNGKFAMNIANLGYKVYLIDKPYNQEISHENISRIKSLEEICSTI